MRNENGMLNSFMPLHEKEYEARLLIDEAVKNKTVYMLEALARALTGNMRKIRFEYAHKEPFLHKEHISGDDRRWIEKTTKYKIEASMGEFYFYGNNETEIWLQIIDFWAGKATIFPCGAAQFPCSTITCTHDSDVKGG